MVNQYVDDMRACDCCFEKHPVEIWAFMVWGFRLGTLATLC